MGFENIKAKFPDFDITATEVLGADGSTSYKVTFLSFDKWQEISQSLKDIGIGGRMTLEGTSTGSSDPALGFRGFRDGSFMYVTKKELDKLETNIPLRDFIEKKCGAAVDRFGKSTDKGIENDDIVFQFEQEAEKFVTEIAKYGVYGVTNPEGAVEDERGNKHNYRKIHERPDHGFHVYLKPEEVAKFLDAPEKSSPTIGGGAPAPVAESAQELLDRQNKKIETFVTKCTVISRYEIGKSVNKGQSNYDIKFESDVDVERFVKGIAGSGVYGAFNPTGEFVDARDGRKHGFRKVHKGTDGFHVYLTPDDVAKLDITTVNYYLDPHLRSDAGAKKPSAVDLRAESKEEIKGAAGKKGKGRRFLGGLFGRRGGGSKEPEKPEVSVPSGLVKVEGAPNLGSLEKYQSSREDLLKLLKYSWGLPGGVDEEIRSDFEDYKEVKIGKDPSIEQRVAFGNEIKAALVGRFRVLDRLYDRDRSFEFQYYQIAPLGHNIESEERYRKLKNEIGEFLSEEIASSKDVVLAPPDGARVGDDKMRVREAAMPDSSVAGAAAVHVATKHLSIGTSATNACGTSGRIKFGESKDIYTKPQSGGGKVCIIDPASPETAKGEIGRAGGFSGILYEQVDGGYDKVIEQINAKKAMGGLNQIVDYTAKAGGHQFGLLSIDGPEANRCSDKSDFITKLTAKYKTIFEKVNEKQGEYSEFRIPVLSGAIFAGDYRDEMPEITAQVISGAIKDIGKVSDKVKLCCGDPEFKKRFDAEFDRIQSAAKVGGAAGKGGGR